MKTSLITELFFRKALCNQSHTEVKIEFSKLHFYFYLPILNVRPQFIKKNALKCTQAIAIVKPPSLGLLKPTVIKN